MAKNINVAGRTLDKISNLLIGFLSSKVFLGLVFVWFIFQAGWMAVSTRLGVSPDEVYHYNFIKLFAQNGWLPFIHHQTGYYSLGEVAHIPFMLYHYLLSLPFHFFGSSPHNIEILRFINIALGALSFYLANKLAIKLKVSPLVKNLSLFMLANTLMFVFLTGAINYDNLLFPLAFATFILLFNLLDKFKASELFLLTTVVLAGSLTAINFLPIAFVAVVTIGFKFLRQPRKLSKQFMADWRKNKVLSVGLLVPLILIFALFSQRYLLNIARYHTYKPSCDTVNTVPQCMKNGIYQRAFFLKTTSHPTHIIPMEYATGWLWNMNSDVFGILGHKSLVPNKLIKVWSELLLIVGTLVVARYYKSEKRWNLLLISAIFYILVLFTLNYLNYERRGLNLGVQGRYLFPFLPFIYLLVNRYIITALKYKKLQITYAILTILVFLTASLPTYVRKTTPDWHSSRAVSVELSSTNTV